MNEIKPGELISSMADGHGSEDSFSRALQTLDADAQSRSDWDTYHLIGDVLRSPDLASGATSAAFVARLRPMLAREAAQQVLHAPRPDAVGDLLPIDLAAARTRGQAANDGSFRWKLVAGLASVAAVAAVGWNLIGTGLDRPQGPQLAAAPSQPAVVQAAAGQRGVMLRDARLDELLAAHRQFGSPAAIQMPIGAVRNAAFEAPSR